MARNKKIAFIILPISVLIFIIVISAVLFSLNKEIDLSLVKTGASSVTRIYYFDYEDRENRIGSAKELKDEELFFQKSEWKSIYDIPKHLSNAFVAVEDKRFYEHSGVDFLRTGKAIFNFIFGKNKKSFGGSTITQQLIKNLTGDNETTPKRKLEEIFRALNLEKKMSKNEILESYLNVVYLSQNCYGVGAGSELYFGKNVEDLTLSESAMLAAIVKSPTNYDPFLNYDKNIKRRNVVLKEMLNQNLISYDEYNEAINEKVTVNENIEKENKTGIYSWFTEALIADVSKDLSAKYHISQDAAKRMIFKGGLNIYATIDPQVQDKAENIYDNYMKYILPENGKYPESACIILDPKTSDILAVVGGFGKKNANMIFNRAINAKRPPGSVIKPLSVYAPALEEGVIKYSSIYDDSPISSKDGVLWPKNSPDRYRGQMPVYYALEHSVNTVAVKILHDLSINKSLQYLSNFRINIDRKTDKNDSSLALGQLTNGESLLNITNAYTVFANGGNISMPKSYLYVTDNYGKIILDNENKKDKVISRETAYIMTKMLQNVVSRGTASIVSLNNKYIQIAGKTGTSSNNEDRWFIGYTPDYVCGIWTGYDIPKPIYSAKNPSCLLFTELFNKLYSNENEISEFLIPENLTIE